jgi:serine/threonine-protein kinase
VLIGRSGEVKLTDFGILRCVAVDRRTQPGEVKGKLGYMSPEQVIGNDVDPRSDLFTLGIILSEMLLLRPLFAGDNELEILSRTYDADLAVLNRFGAELPAAILSVVRKALARERRDRFQSAREFHSALLLAARNAKVEVWDSELVAWLGSLGVLTSRSGTHEVARAEPAVTSPAPSAASSAEPTVVPPPLDANVEPPAESQRIAAARPPRGESGAQRTYSVRVPNGRTLDSLKLPQICELLGTGRLRPEYEVSVGGSLWAPVSQVPLFANTVSRLGPLFASIDAIQSAWRWNVMRRDLPRVLFRLAARKHNGMLVARSGRREKRVWLADGMPLFVASSDRTELLGAYLVQRGVLRRGDVDRALQASCENGGQLLGEALVQRGMVSTPVLLQVLGDQLCERFAELVRWTDGQLTFVAGQTAQVPHLPHPKSAASLIARAVRRAFDPEEIASWYLPLSASRVSLRRGSTLDLEPTDAERRVLALAAEGPSLEGLIRDASAQQLPTGDIWRALYLALSAELVAFDQAG